MGPNTKELFRLVEDFVDVIGFCMKDLWDTYQVNSLGKLTPRSANPHAPAPQSWAGPLAFSFLIFK